MVDGPFRILDFDYIQVQIQVAPLTGENTKAYLDGESKRIRDRLAEGHQALTKAVVIVDGSCDLMPPAEVRRLYADWINQNQDLLKTYVQGMAYVIPSSLVRGAMTAVMWMAPLPMEVTTHDRLETALDYAIATIDRTGGTVSDELLMGGVELIESRRMQATEGSSLPSARAPAVSQATAFGSRPAPSFGSTPAPISRGPGHDVADLAALAQSLDVLVERLSQASEPDFTLMGAADNCAKACQSGDYPRVKATMGSHRGAFLRAADDHGVRELGHRLLAVRMAQAERRTG